MATSEFGDRLKWVREKRLGFDAFAEMARELSKVGYDVTGLSVSRYETGEREAPAAYVRFVAEMAGVDPGWLLAGVGDADGKKPAPDGQERAAVEPIGDAERIELLGMLADVQRVLVEGRKSVAQAAPPLPTSQPPIIPPIGAEEPERQTG